VIKEILFDIIKTSLHKSLIIVVSIAAVFLTLEVILKPGPEVATIVFATSGTMVALVLPAAQLANESIRRIGEYWLERVNERVSGDGKDYQAIENTCSLAMRFITEIKGVASFAWRGSIYVLFAFFLSSIALLTPRVMLCSYIILVDYILLGGALGFLLVGAFLYYPFAGWVYYLKRLKDIEGVIRGTEMMYKERMHKVPPELKNNL
jgi:hypothetical protein